ncbi:MAG: hypothetical protein NC217_08835 [Muribaculaceae bacterium]|nr:hypothetical protein [Muribaculaceae bacterium]
MAIDLNNSVENTTTNAKPEIVLADNPNSATSAEMPKTGHDMLHDIKTSQPEQPAWHGVTQSLKMPHFETNNGGQTTSALDNEDNEDNAAITASSIVRKVPEEFASDNYADVIKWLEARRDEFKPLSKEEVEKLRRRQKAEGIISGVSDVARSIANMVAVHNYAPNMYDAGNSMSARAQARFDKDKAEREADNDKFFNYAMMIGRLKDQDKENRLNIFKMNYQMERDALQDAIREASEKRAEAKADRDEKLADLKYEIAQGKLSEQEAKAREQKIRADYAEELIKADLAVKNSTVQKNKAQANRANRPATTVRSGGRTSMSSSSNNVWLATDPQTGEVHPINAKSKPQALSHANARGWILDVGVESSTSTTTSKDAWGGESTKTTSKTTTSKPQYTPKRNTKKHIGW